MIEEQVISVEGRFDALVASEMKARLHATRDDSTVIVDFSRVSQYDDFALAILARELTSPAKRRVVLRGLCYRQERLLRYFGIVRSSPASAVREGQPPSW